MSKIVENEKGEIWVGSEKFVTLISEEKIQNRIKELGEQISKEYQGKLPILIGVLNGSFIFLSDLVKKIDIHIEIDFFKLSSYGDAKISSGEVKLIKELNADINERHILIVEDIVDTGLSIQFIKNILKNYKPASVKIVSLLVKPESLKNKMKIDYIGFEIPNKFVIGYGLDYAQKYRNLNSIFALSE
ncbi:MAG: hypoxanthine phosphoribosyltransferase [Ignavibacteriales bacterium]|jgi:hypoxanthine phosphoribosyltransferase|nr:hypoxanthine phosphoribosyltransferase [Ignavibacteriales bacterium]MBK7981438.1 hypoxanthine phosphoribosyltransferase [Ignavibacteriota bacterium]